VTLRPNLRRLLPFAVFAAAGAGCGIDSDPTAPDRLSGAPRAVGTDDLDAELNRYLSEHGFTGRVGATLEARLGRPVDRRLADLGRLLWFDPITGLNDDNTCGGCHSPTNGFGDTQPIAIGIENNGIVGPDRRGPRNQRRSPLVLNAAFFPTLMWNSRFAAPSGNPFDNSAGFEFPPPEGRSLSYLPHLLVAQAFIPPTERVEVAGFHFPGDNTAIRNEVLRRLNATAEYRWRFAQLFADVRQGAPINFDHFGLAIAEFEFSLIFADAPIDRYARGEPRALSVRQKQGAVLFFGRAGCVRCHAVSGRSNEMFSDFAQHVIGTPQVAPSVGNVVFDGPGRNEDFGLEQVTGNPSDRYAFRTSPLRNVALQSAFMHNGAFVRLEDAIRHHLDPLTSARSYSPAALAPDLAGPLGPIEPVLDRLDPLLGKPLVLSDDEVAALVDFVGEGLLDPAARPERLRGLIPHALPSGRAPLTFQFR
jgi:cytochrome c peroxidase